MKVYKNLGLRMENDGQSRRIASEFPIVHTFTVSEVVEERRPQKRFKRGCLWVSLVGFAALGWWLYPVVRALIYLNPWEKVDPRTYDGSSMQNFKSLHQAMMLYHESEGMFPESSGWMDAIEIRMLTYDMSKEETAKKFVYPELRGQLGKYGYGMNDACSRKYRDDISNPDTTPLLFDSSDLSRNAHGAVEKLLPSPARQGQNRGVSVNGQMLKL